MKIENIKSMILVALVLFSIVLFWNLVTFQRNYESVNNQEYVKEVSISNVKKQMKDLIIPNKIIYRSDEGRYSGIQQLEKLGAFTNEMTEWSFYGFQRSVNEFNNKFEGSPGSQVLIIQYPGEVPYELLKSMYSVETKEVPSGNFQNMFIFKDDVNGNDGVVYFASKDLKSIIKANIHSNSLSHINQFIDEVNSNGSPYYAYKKKAGGYLFVLNKEIVIPNEQYYPQLYDENTFVEALFSNPDLVTINEDEYTDGSSLLKLQSEQKMLIFVDTTVTDSPNNVYNMIMTSVNYINGHGGWTDQYYYSGAYVNTKRINFQLYTNDYPVFNDYGLNELSLIVGNNKIHEYRRPYFRLDFIPYNPTKQEFTLPKGRDVLDEIHVNGVDLETVDDILIGYQMKNDMEKALIKFQPSWFYKIGNSWIQVSDKKLEGAQDGLE